MDTFESLHPRAGGTGPDRTQFASRAHADAGLVLEPGALHDMDSAPTDGTVIELLVDGDWHEAYWSADAYDGSPYGTEGWATVEDHYLVLDAEKWKPSESDIIVDEDAERMAFLKEREAARLADEARERRKAAARTRERTRRNREYAEDRYKTLTGVDISGQKIPKREIDRVIAREEAKRTAASLAKALQGFF